MRNNNSKKWLITVGLFLFFTVILIGSMNYIVDPYGMNHSVKEKNFNLYKKSNIGYIFRVKTKAYEAKKFTNLMIGTSRVGVMNPAIVDNLLGGSTFNFSAPGSVAKIHKELFLYAVKNQDLKNVIYGIDFLSLNGSLKIKESFKEFALIQKKLEENSDIHNLDLYYNLDTIKDSFRIIKSNATGKVLREKRYVYENGMRDYMDYLYQESHGQYDAEKETRHNLRSYYHPDRVGGYQNYMFSYEYLKDIKEIVTYCHENLINLWVYIPPMYQDHFDALSAYGIYDEFELFKRELVKIIDFTDFTGHNSVTNDKKYFWDGSHLKSQYTNLVIEQVLKDEANASAEDFGSYVTKENIESHLKKLSNSIRPFDMKSLLESKE